MFLDYTHNMLSCSCVIAGWWNLCFASLNYIRVLSSPFINLAN